MPLTDRAYITGNVLHLSCLMSDISVFFLAVLNSNWTTLEGQISGPEHTFIPL